MFELRASRVISYRKDLLSGLTVALALVPEAVAFAFVAGVEPLVGLYAAFMVGLITACIGGRPGMISGATGALAVVMVSLVALVNSILGLFGDIGGSKITLQLILGYLCVPFAYIIGIPLSETVVAGGLIGQKVVLNEFLAYLDLLKVPAGALSERSKLLLTYALCGFANLGSLGILIGGLSVLCPERRVEIVELAPRALIIGFLTTLLTASIIGTTVWQ